jgi:hypothetical protein
MQKNVLEKLRYPGVKKYVIFVQKETATGLEYFFVTLDTAANDKFELVTEQQAYRIFRQQKLFLVANNIRN